MSERRKKRTAESRIGDRYARLVVVSVKGRQKMGHYIRTIIECKCDCGNIKTAPLSDVVSGKTKSCGCLNRETATRRCIDRTKHGMARKSGDRTIYQLWYGMIQRCINADRFGYKHYGGRGIKVCGRWILSVEDFAKDMGPRPTGTSIDRIDNNGNYEPSNCRWATIKQQARNRRDTIRININNANVSLSEACEQARLSYGAVYRRIEHGWDLEKALSKPIRTNTKK